MFKASDYRISPFELESVLIEHPAVAEAAVVPSPDELRLAVPKAYVALAAGRAAEPRSWPATSCATAASTSRPYKRIRRLEFAELPKTISGKIRRVELRPRRPSGAGARRRASTARRTSASTAQRIGRCRRELPLKLSASSSDRSRR